MSFPAVDTIVEVVAPGDVELTAEVKSATPNGVTVEWGGDAPASGTGEARWPGERGLHVLPCTISGEGRFGLLEATSEPLVVQRRDAVRVELRVPVLRPDTGGHVRAQTVNVSTKGLLVAGDLGLGVGDITLLAIELPDAPMDPLVTKGRVQHNHEPGLFGIQLQGVTQGQEDRIAKVLFEQQRVLLRRRHEQKTHLRLVREGE